MGRLWTRLGDPHGCGESDMRLLGACDVSVGWGVYGCGGDKMERPYEREMWCSALFGFALGAVRQPLWRGIQQRRRRRQCVCVCGGSALCCVKVKQRCDTRGSSVRVCDVRVI